MRANIAAIAYGFAKLLGAGIFCAVEKRGKTQNRHVVPTGGDLHSHIQMIRTASIAFAFVASCYIATTIGDRRFHGETETLIRALVDDEADSAAAGQKEIDQDIPPAILKYLGSALPDDALQGKVPRYARVSQRGLIAMSEGNWTDFEATKVVALPPRLQRGYVWTCILNFYGIKVYIRDSLVGPSAVYSLVFPI